MLNLPCLISNELKLDLSSTELVNLGKGSLELVGGAEKTAEPGDAPIVRRFPRRTGGSSPAVTNPIHDARGEDREDVQPRASEFGLSFFGEQSARIAAAGNPLHCEGSRDEVQRASFERKIDDDGGESGRTAKGGRERV